MIFRRRTGFLAAGWLEVVVEGISKIQAAINSPGEGCGVVALAVVRPAFVSFASKGDRTDVSPMFLEDGREGSASASMGPTQERGKGVEGGEQEKITVVREAREKKPSDFLFGSFEDLVLVPWVDFVLDLLGAWDHRCHTLFLPCR